MNLFKSLKLTAALGTLAIATSAFAGTVSTDGSTSMEKVIGLLSESYHEAHPQTNVTYNPTGSGAGIAAALEGRCDIGLSSRDLKDKERQSLTGTVVALDGIAMVVNKDNAVSDLTVEQLTGVYTGKITNWKELGGADRPIVLIGREAGSGTRDGFESVTHTKDKCKYRQELTSTGDVITTVSTNVNAIGYASLSAVGKKVKPLTINGVHASEATILDGSYKLQRPFLMVTRKGQQLSPDAQDFMGYALSAEAKPLIEKAGVVPAAK
ncbi:MAG: phosphate ABC transporter substrate-binding protein [Succinivibrionaceae bacterium]|nr:phosphate ABC transporter substrate-binding protein [Succinivibrionaceae bacterium]